MNDLCNLRLQFVDKLLGIVFLVLYVAQLLFPDTCQFAALQQFLANQVDQFDACRCGNQTFTLSLDIVAFEEGLDDGGSARRAPDAVFLHGGS